MGGFKEQSASADGGSVSLALNAGDNLIEITATTLDASTVAILQTSTDDFSRPIQHQDPQDSSTPCQLDADDAVNGGGYGRSFVVTGPGQARLWVENIGASTGIRFRVSLATAR